MNNVRFEYQELWIKRSSLVEELNILGKSGWRLVHVLGEYKASFTKIIYIQAIMMRQIK